MDEQAQLQAKIAALAGRINQHKQTGSNAQSNVYSGAHHHHHHQPSNRWTPYTAQSSHQSHPPYPRGGGYQKPPFPSHRNKTLVVNNTPNSTNNSNGGSETPSRATSEGPGWVSKRDRGHMQLINTSVYDQKMQQKQLDMEDTAKERRRQRNEQEKAKIIRHVTAIASAHSTPTTPGTPREIIISDMRFRVAADGSKLIRIFGESTRSAGNTKGPFLNNADGSNKDAQTTPKQAKIAGVTFHRSKNGNLYRAGLVKNSLSKAKPTKSTKLCAKFTSTGVCPLGPRCQFTHDMNKVAICQQFLRHGECAASGECNLSHDLTPNRVPWCIHFMRGNCNNEGCRYLHVKPSSSAPVCRPFATMGYCEKGAECGDRHVIECPDYANTGDCRNKECRLPHVDSVANKRRAEAAKSVGKKSSQGTNDSSDLSSDEEDYQEIDSDDVDSDELDEEDVVMAGSGEQSHELARQQDFISFS